MNTVTLGATGIAVLKKGLDAAALGKAAGAEKLFGLAYEGGIRFFDTERGAFEEKLGAALSGVRRNVYISGRFSRATSDGLWEDLEASMKALGTDYFDIYQLDGTGFVPRPGDGAGLYDAITWAKSSGVIKHIGISTGSLAIAREAVLSGLYETVRYPFGCRCSLEEDELARLAKKRGVGFIASDPTSGGAVRSFSAANAFLSGYDVLPLWGAKSLDELESVLSL